MYDNLLLLWRYSCDRFLALSTISFHLRRSCTCSAQFISFILFRSFLTSSSHRDLGLPSGLPVNGFHSCNLFTVLVSGILLMCPNQLNRRALTQFIMFRCLINSSSSIFVLILQIPLASLVGPNTGLFGMIVGVLTTSHTQYT